MMYEGLIIKATAGFYYVKCGDEIIECRARGIFRKEGISPLVGDRVGVEAEGGNGTVCEILPRKNGLSRPPLANLDRLVIVSSSVDPQPDTFAVDKLIAMAEHCGMEPVVVFSKTDLDDVRPYAELYQRAGFRAFAVSTVTGEGVREVADLLYAGGISAFTGNSGVGKSSLLNRIAPRLSLCVGEVSRKLGRGRHTTRTVELFELCGETGAWVADTPGFASLDLEQAKLADAEQLQHDFREFEPFIGKCRFADCAHVREAGCAVRRAVEQGVIAKSRHESYCAMYAVLKAVKPWEQKKNF